jgi:predicted Zn-dependent peptidase
MPLDTELFLQQPAPGATLIVDVMPGSAAVALGLWFPAGSAYESEDEQGLSHFVEHMLFKGAGERDAEALSRVIDREGGSLNAFTEREAVCIHCTLPAEKAELAAQLLLDMAYRPRFERKDFELEKDIIVSEILAAEDDLEEAGQDVFYAMSYPGQPIGRSIAGKADIVQSHAFESLLSFHERRILNAPVLMTIAGDVDSRRMAELFSKALERRGRAAKAPLTAPAVYPGRFASARAMVSATGSQVYFFTGLPLAEPLSEDDYWMLSLISSAYGESMSSRLFMRLREREGLCYSIGTSFSFSRLAGLWGVASACSASQFPRFADAYRREAQNLFESGLHAEEIREALSRIAGLMRVASDDVEFRMNRLARQFLFDGQAENLAVSLERLNQPRFADESAVAAYIRARLDPERENVLLYGTISKRVLKAGAEAFKAVKA